MNYYHRWPADYLAATVDLSMMEDGAYNRLMDWCYANERGVPDDKKFIIARATNRAEKAAVFFVLETFFKYENGVWIQDRIHAEISKALVRIESSKINGLKGGRPKKEKPGGFVLENPVGSSTETHGITQMKPRAKAPQSPISKEEQDQKKKEPPLPPNGKKPRTKRQGMLLTAWLETLKETGEDAIPEGDPIFRFAENAGLPLDYLRITYRVFKRDMIDREKVQKDWRAHFRNAVRRDWYRLYARNRDGEWYLTTAGQLAMMELKGDSHGQ